MCGQPGVPSVARPRSPIHTPWRTSSVHLWTESARGLNGPCALTAEAPSTLRFPRAPRRSLLLAPSLHRRGSQRCASRPAASQHLVEFTRAGSHMWATRFLPARLLGKPSLAAAEPSRACGAGAPTLVQPSACGHVGCCQFGAFLSLTNHAERLSLLIPRLRNFPAVCLQIFLSFPLSFVSLLSYQGSPCVLDSHVFSDMNFANVFL